MRKIGALVVLMMSATFMASGISPYVHIADLPGSMSESIEKVKNVLTENNYRVIGDYRPGGDPDLHVIVFTNDKITGLCNRADGRSMLAAGMKIGLQKTEGKIKVSIVNPEYLFYAFFREKMNEASFKSSALDLSAEITNGMRDLGSVMEPFGGDLSAKELMKYHYMVGMPYFDDPVKLRDFDSFQHGLNTIQRNLNSKSGNTQKVYEIIDQENNVAVFGVGLPDKEEGEAHFLPIIGESHVAAMPYEIILLNKRATILHGRYRFALYWPELTMKTFTKIMSSPGDVEEAMSTVVK